MILSASLLFSGQLFAATQSYTGNFVDDDDRFYTSFTVTADSLVTLTSWGYAGGINAAGNAISDGGFDSQLFIFDTNSNLLRADDDSGSVVSVSSGLSWDAFISMNLVAGDYIAVLTQFNSDYQSGDLYSGIWSPSNATNFVDLQGHQRNSAYAFDISGDYITDIQDYQVGTVPVPAAAFMFAPALLGFMGLRRKVKTTVV